MIIPQSILRKIALSLLIIFYAVISERVSAKGLDDICCDSIYAWYEPDSNQVDSCHGTVFFRIADNPCGITIVLATGTNGALSYNPATNTYEARYSIISGGSKTIIATFYNALGLLCTKELIIGCPQCCDSLEVYYEHSDTTIDVCCGYVFFQVDSINACYISALVTSNSDSVEWDEVRNAFKVHYCLGAETSQSLTGYFINLWGDTVCAKGINIICHKDSCCDQIELVNTQDIDPCCGTFTFKFSDKIECAIDKVILDEEYYDGSTFSYHYCLNPQTARSFTFYLLNSNGDTICIKTSEVRCDEEPSALAAGVILGKVHPNPAASELTAEYFSSTKAQTTFEIFNFRGEVLLTRTVDGKTSGISIEAFDVKDMNEGLYLLKVSCNGRTEVKRFSVSR